MSDYPLIMVKWSPGMASIDNLPRLADKTARSRSAAAPSAQDALPEACIALNRGELKDRKLAAPQGADNAKEKPCTLSSRRAASSIESPLTTF
jgi:hypothetical protein